MLALDADRAGREAMLRAQAVGGKRLRLRVARMPEGKDPADLLAGGDGVERDGVPGGDRGRRGPAGVPCPHAARRRRPGLAGGARPGARRGRGGDRAMPDSITREELMREVADRLDADPGLVARRRRRPAGRGSGGRRRPRRRRRADGAAAPTPRALNARERRELGAAGDVREAAGRGRRVRSTGSPTTHFSSSVAARARAWLRDHLEDPLDGLPRDDEELFAYVTELKMRADASRRAPRRWSSASSSSSERRSTTRSPRRRPTAARPGRAPAPPRRAHRAHRAGAVLAAAGGATGAVAELVRRTYVRFPSAGRG